MNRTCLSDGRPHQRFVYNVHRVRLFYWFDPFYGIFLADRDTNYHVTSLSYTWGRESWVRLRTSIDVVAKP